MKRFLSLITPLFILALALLDAPCSHANPLSRAKARYYFTQGSIEASQNNMPEAYEYFKKAFELDTTYKDAAFTYGTQRIFLQSDSLQNENELRKSLKMTQEYVDAFPTDIYATQMYGYLSTALDTVEEAVRVYERTSSLLPRETYLLQNLADAYMRVKKGRDALGALERYEAIEGKSHEITLKKVSILLSEKDTLAAINEVNLLMEANPGDPYSRIMKGNLYEIVGDMDSVVAAYKEAERLAPENGAVKMSLAQYYRTTGDSVMLDNMVYEALLSEEYELEDKLGILGEYLQKLLDEEGDKSRGDHLFSVLQEQYPHDPDVLDMAARYAAAKGNYDEAIESIGYAIDMDPSNERYWLMLMSFQLSQNQYEQVVEEYGRAKEHFAPSLRLKNLYASSASMLEDRQRVEDIINGLLVETDPRTTTPEGRKELRNELDYESLQFVSNLYTILGDMYYKDKEADKAFDEYEIALYFFPENALALNNYAYFLSEENRELEKAKKMSALSLELVDANPTYLDTYAWILYKMGDLEDALEVIQKAIELANEIGDDNEEYQKHLDVISEALK